MTFSQNLLHIDNKLCRLTVEPLEQSYEEVNCLFQWFGNNLI